MRVPRAAALQPEHDMFGNVAVAPRRSHFHFPRAKRCAEFSLEFRTSILRVGLDRRPRHCSQSTFLPHKWPKGSRTDCSRSGIRSPRSSCARARFRTRLRGPRLSRGRFRGWPAPPRFPIAVARPGVARATSVRPTSRVQGKCHSRGHQSSILLGIAL